MAEVHTKQPVVTKTVSMGLDLSEKVDAEATKYARPASQVVQAALRLAFMRPDLLKQELNEPTYDWADKAVAHTQA